MLSKCKNCPAEEGLFDKLKELDLFKNVVWSDDESQDDDEDLVMFKMWGAINGRCALLDRQLSKADFMRYLVNELYNALRHQHVSQTQSAFVNELKASIPDGHVIIHMDFAENFAFCVQDSIQGFYWDNSQVTVHPVVVYCRRTPQFETECMPFVIISDTLKHDNGTVHYCQMKIIEWLKSHNIQPDYCHYITDGAGSQYKNRKAFLNLALHEKDFGFSAELQNFATSHGKGACDGVGGAVKRSARKASLHGVVIRNPKEFY